MSSSAPASACTSAASSARAAPCPLPARRCRMSWAIRSPSCSHEQDVARERGLLRVVREQVAQQQRAALDVAPGLLEEREQLGVRLRLRWPHAAGNARRARARRAGRVHNPFTGRSHAVTASRPRARQPARADGVDARRRGAAGRGSGGPAGRPPRAGGGPRAAALGAGARPARGAAAPPGADRAARGALQPVWGAPLRSERPLGRRLHPQAAGEARARAAGVALHPHALRLRLPPRAGAFTSFSHGCGHSR